MHLHASVNTVNMQRLLINSLWKRKHFDWSGVMGGALSECWNPVCSDTIVVDTAEFDMRLLLPHPSRCEN